MSSLSCFKAYDIRGIVPNELNTDIAYTIGRAFATVIDCRTVVVGHDIRLTGPKICDALARGLMEQGTNVINIGLCGTEEIYHAVQALETDAGICVTASHNPANYNGMKFVGKYARPISRDNGLSDIQRIAENRVFTPSKRQGHFSHTNLRSEYADRLISCVDTGLLKPLKLVVNAGNSGAGLVIDALEAFLPFHFVKLHHQPDGNFPNGVPNPLLEENRQETSRAVIEHQADIGIAWDGDFDRCFFFDEKGQFVDGYYIVGLLAKTLLGKHPGRSIVYDPRLYWNTVELVAQAGGKPVVSKTGHAFVKQAMRQHNAIYGGEMSAHHYFADFGYCDNGHLPWLLISELLSQSRLSLSDWVDDSIKRFPCSGEINLHVADADQVLIYLERCYTTKANKVEKLDGLGMEFDRWRFNVRASNTEPLLRVNVESRGDKALLEAKTQELLKQIERV
ncbi:phosphomannomutase [Alteromonas oceanisediminis]|uniref:phosphomannomutase n=1 Tax=Alteromonas oceanisediminis TaxID=2836180 RepID=UPI001BD9278D|nr:phosphomannomutase [Alteromonas oceanisediminis]MBT0586813.1 phosphomannomutase [Alteromonas oceanisediminis]